VIKKALGFLLAFAVLYFYRAFNFSLKYPIFKNKISTPEL